MNCHLALIPARGGSKSIPGKNLYPLAGRPLIAHTIASAADSGVFDRILVSTDSDEIAAVSRGLGASVPFLRPASMATDRSLVVDAALHALDRLHHDDRYEPTFVMLLQPTSPLRGPQDIRAALDLAARTDAEAVVSVTQADRHPCQMKTIDRSGALVPFMPSPLLDAPRQEIPPVYALNGAIYLIRPDVLKRTRSWCPPGALAYVMPPERSLDIDTPWDMRLVELILRAGMPRAAVSGEAAHARR